SLSSGGPIVDQMRPGRRPSLKKSVMTAVPMAITPMAASRLTHQGPARMSFTSVPRRRVAELDACKEWVVVGAEDTRAAVVGRLVDARDRDLADAARGRAVQHVIERQADAGVIGVPPRADA